MIFPQLPHNISSVSCTPIPCPRGEIFWIGVFVGAAVVVSMGLAAYMIWRVKQRNEDVEDEE